MKIFSFVVLFAIGVPGMVLARDPNLKKTKTPPPSIIDQMIHDAEQDKRDTSGVHPTSGSLYSARFGNFTREFRAEGVNDILTVLISDNISAVTNGTTNGQRKASSTGSVQAPIGPNLTAGLTATLTGNNQLQAQGTTVRTSTLTAALTVRVTHVLPGGTMVVEGMKQIDVNAEHQWVSLRGVIRAKDLTPANTVNSDQVANIELRVNGKGVVNDYIRRPNLLYRILNGIIPF